jgi:hypothetical protein
LSSIGVGGWKLVCVASALVSGFLEAVETLEGLEVVPLLECTVSFAASACL